MVSFEDSDILFEAETAENVAALQSNLLVLDESLQANQAVGRVLHNIYKGIRLNHFSPSLLSFIGRFGC